MEGNATENDIKTTNSINSNSINSNIPEIKILGWDIVGLWSLDIQIKTCAICRNHIMDTCVECQNGLVDPQGCTFDRGKCGHAFHSHCISKWLNSKNVCPLDTQPWVYERQKEK
ncbi:E3 ubiquitin-protein ligase RBX1 [Enteropsectra breve]|nr:E3 ubiquitin-protein ligase RBX1 [Enteropsectra breve]